ncbi:hypothetical protein GCM10010531_16090 [Blastococcus jejuensis]|uniref:Uncharacterized protein n=1 Tax=Blastococcus jejuensis TaxID=351224 RepID=A0ABP6P462_9ACTN
METPASTTVIGSDNTTTVRRTLRAGALTSEVVSAPADAIAAAGEPLDYTGDAVDVAMMRAAVHPRRTAPPRSSCATLQSATRSPQSSLRR